jgi:hypothetical protein
LNGQGVPNLHEALSKLRLQPLHAALRHVLCREQVDPFVAASRAELAQAAAPAGKSMPGSQTGIPAQSHPRSASHQDDEAVARFFERADEFYWRLTELLPEAQSAQISDDLEKGKSKYREALRSLVRAAVALPSVTRDFSTAWPSAVGETIPGASVGVSVGRTWTPVLAYILLHALPGTADLQVLFDEMDMRAALAESFAEVGIEGEDVWRSAARVRLLLAGRTPVEALHTEGFWADGDVRWLTGVNESEGATYVNRESFEQLLCWLQLPALLGLAGGLGGEDADAKPAGALKEIETEVGTECQRMSEAGYKLEVYLGEEIEPEPSRMAGEIIAH